jgi:hypothetical protein
VTLRSWVTINSIRMYEVHSVTIVLQRVNPKENLESELSWNNWNNLTNLFRCSVWVRLLARWGRFTQPLAYLLDWSDQGMPSWRSPLDFVLCPGSCMELYVHSHSRIHFDVLSRRNNFALAFTPFLRHICPVSRSRNSAVGFATGCGLENRRVEVRVPVDARIFSSPRCPDRFWDQSRILSSEQRGSYPG